MNVDKYFSLAKKASQFSNFCGKTTSRHTGCVIVYKNNVVGVGWNIDKEHPLQKKYNKERGFNPDCCKNSLHAEMYALVKSEGLDIDWEKAAIFTYRQYANLLPAMARPCRACMAAIKDRGIKNIYYTTEYGWANEVLDEQVCDY